MDSTSLFTSFLFLLCTVSKLSEGNPRFTRQIGKCICIDSTLCAERESSSSSSKRDSCPSFGEVCCRTPIGTRTNNRRPCGRRNAQGHDSNKNSEFGEFPWMIGIIDNKDRHQESFFKCGGSLIHPQVILTAAHCVQGHRPESLIARAGEWDHSSESEPAAHQDRRVQRIIINGEFTINNLHNDIALLYLESPFNLEEHIDIVCLPKQDDIIESNNCYTSGWGKLDFERSQYSSNLKKVHLSMIDSETCQEKFRATDLGKYFNLDMSFVCAGGKPGQDSCTGDGGSPLTCPVGNLNSYYQTGIVAWGVGCGSDTPGAYVNVARFREWIDGHMKNLGLQPYY